MAVNSLQGANAYTNSLNPSNPLDTTHLQDQNREASQTDLNTENTSAAQNAFEVNITQAAQNLQAAETNGEATQTTPSEDETNQNPMQIQELNRIVNIIA